MSMKAKLGHSAASGQSRPVFAALSKQPSVKEDPFSRLPAMRKRAADSHSK